MNIDVEKSALYEYCNNMLALNFKYNYNQDNEILNLKFNELNALKEELLDVIEATKLENLKERIKAKIFEIEEICHE